MMKKFALLLMFCAAAFFSVAQSEMMNAAINLSIAAQSNNSLDKGIYVEGSPYKEKETVTGIFYQKEKPVVETQTRLNYFQSSFEFIVNDKTFLVDANSVDSVRVKGHTYLYRTFDYNGKTLPRVVEVVEKGDKFSIYKFTMVEFKQEVKAGGYVEPKPACYSWDEPVYLVETENNMITLTNFKKLTSTFTENEDEVKKYIKENKIRKDNPEELIQLIHYLNGLM